MESLSLMMGGSIKSSDTGSTVTVSKTEEGVVGATATVMPVLVDHNTKQPILAATIKNKTGKFINLTKGVRGTFTISTEGAPDGVAGDTVAYTANGASHTPTEGDKIRYFWDEDVVEKDAAVEITISPSTFPGTLTQAA